MPPHGKSAHDTATVQRLLDSAAHEFARHGYAATRVRDIVDAAGVNLAAVNYHFGGKEGLYRATLAMLASRARDDVPTDSPEMRAAPPEEQLRAFARATLVRYLGQEQPLAASRIMAHELLDPTPAFESTMRQGSRPQWERLIEIVSALIGSRASRDDVELTTLSIAGQWAFFLFGRRLFEFQFPDLARKAAIVDQVADHIAAFSIAGIRARRQELEAQGTAAGIRDAPVRRGGDGASLAAAGAKSMDADAERRIPPKSLVSP